MKRNNGTRRQMIAHSDHDYVPCSSDESEKNVQLHDCVNTVTKKPYERGVNSKNDFEFVSKEVLIDIILEIKKRAGIKNHPSIRIYREERN